MGKVQRFNDIVNERNLKGTSMTMSMSLKRVYGVRAKKLPEEEVDDCADCLVAMFGAPGSKPLFCDAVRYLEKSYLDEQAKYAMQHGRKPVALFGAIVFRQLVKAGVYPSKH